MHSGSTVTWSQKETGTDTVEFSYQVQVNADATGSFGPSVTVVENGTTYYPGVYNNKGTVAVQSNDQKLNVGLNWLNDDVNNGQYRSDLTIWVTEKATGKRHDPVNLAADYPYPYLFENLPKYDRNGKEPGFTVMCALSNGAYNLTTPAVEKTAANTWEYIANATYKGDPSPYYLRLFVMDDGRQSNIGGTDSHVIYSTDGGTLYDLYEFDSFGDSTESAAWLRTLGFTGSWKHTVSEQTIADDITLAELRGMKDIWAIDADMWCYRAQFEALTSTEEPTPAIKTYTITYNTNGGSGSVLSQNLDEANTVATIAAGTLLNKTDYTFNGWNTAADGSGTPVAVGSLWTALKNNSSIWTVNDNKYSVTLYAQWLKNEEPVEPEEPETSFSTVTKTFESTDISDKLKEVLGLANVSDPVAVVTAKLEEDLSDTKGEMLGTVTHEVTLMYTDENGVKQQATAEQFEQLGKLPVELPVPEDSNPALHAYYVAHMFTEGSKAGTREYPRVSVVPKNGKYFITFEVTGLSPMTIGWQEKPVAVPADAAFVPTTGDNTQLALLFVLTAVSGAVLVMAMRKRKHA